jgi:uncharacterized protein involved in type VI secretion and phage assembly
MPDDRAVRLTTALGDRLRFRRLLGEEALSRPFRFDLELATRRSRSMTFWARLWRLKCR